MPEMVTVLVAPESVIVVVVTSESVTVVVVVAPESVIVVVVVETDTVDDVDDTVEFGGRPQSTRDWPCEMLALPRQFWVVVTHISTAKWPLVVV